MIGLLCLQTVLPNQLMEDVVRLPILIAHYLHHNHTEKHIHFAEFIVSHYSNQEHHDIDHNNHNNLPFHHHDFNFQQAFFSTPAENNFLDGLTNCSIAVARTKIISRQHFYTSTALSSIWRPPKGA